MKQIFVTAFQRWTDILALGGRAPIGCRSHCPMICGEADQHGFVYKSLANQLADVHFTVMTHLGGTRVA